jgi:flagellar motor switch protein FliG
MSPNALTGAQKAAIIVRLLSAEGSAMPLASLSPKAQRRLTQQFLSLGKIDRDTVDAVIQDFTDQVSDPSLSFPGDLMAALTMIENDLSPEVANDLRRGAGLAMQKDPWIEIAKLPVPVLAATLLQEGMQVGAIVLSKLTPESASEVMAALPEDVAKDMAYAVEQTKSVTPDVVSQIGTALSYLTAPSGPQAFDAPPVSRVAEILNAATGAQRDALIAALQEVDKEFATQVRDAIFTFADIPTRIEPTDIPKIVRVVDGEALVTALVAATEEIGEAVEFILANMSQRMADQLRDEMSEVGTVMLKPGEQAMGQVTSAIRKLKEDGEIFFIKKTEEDEPAT